MRFPPWHAPALLLLYQIAPVHAGLDEFGRFQAAFGFSTGGYETDQFDCGGKLISRSKTSYTVISGQADAWISPVARISVAGGVIHGSSDTPWGNTSEGGFGSVLGKL